MNVHLNVKESCSSHFFIGSFASAGLMLVYENNEEIEILQLPIITYVIYMVRLMSTNEYSFERN